MHPTISPSYLSYGYCGLCVVCSKLVYKTPSVRFPPRLPRATHSSHDCFTFRSPSEKDPESLLSEEADGNGLGRLIPEPTIRDLTGKIDDPSLGCTQAIGGYSDVYRCRLKQPDGKGPMVS